MYELFYFSLGAAAVYSLTYFFHKFELSKDFRSLELFKTNISEDFSKIKQEIELFKQQIELKFKNNSVQ